VHAFHGLKIVWHILGRGHLGMLLFRAEPNHFFRYEALDFVAQYAQAFGLDILFALHL